MTAPPRTAQAYIGVVLASATAALVLSLAGVGRGAWRTVALLATMQLLVGTLSRHESHRPNESAPSLSGIVVLGALFLCGPAAAVLVASVGFVVEDRSSELVKRAFNSAMLILAAGAAGLVMVGLGGGWHGLDFDGFPHDLLPALGADVAVFLTSVGLVSLVIALCAHLRPMSVARGLIDLSALLVLGNGLLGLALAVVWGPCGIGPLSAALVVVPLLLARFTYNQIADEQRAYDSTVRALVRAVETKDVYTRHHSERVSKASVLIARESNMPERMVPSLRYAGLLHDVGKIGVPTRVLQKADRLTEAEFDAIKLHPVRGREMVAEIDFLEEARAGIFHHHERLDGRGYPMGLAGADIPEFARIIAVADAFDSMTSTRSYRGARSVEAAVAELRRCAGTQFDAPKVEALIRALGRNPWEPATDPAPPLVAALPQPRGHYDDAARAGSAPLAALAPSDAV